MNNPNPYSAPNAELTRPNDQQEFPLHPPRTVNAGQGVQWLVEGFNYFKQDVGIWIAICVIGFVLMIVLNLIPVVNLFVSFTMYVWIGGLMLGCKAQYDREPLQINHLFAGFKEAFVPLLLLSICLMLAVFIIMAIALGSAFFQVMGLVGGEEPSVENLSGILLSVLIAVSLTIPITMLGWFAPALIVLHKVPLFKAMGMSFQACLKNVVPFLIYGVVLLVLAMLAAIPFGLGFLVLIPVLYASIFCSYKDIFVDE